MTDESDSDRVISHRSTAYRSVRTGIAAAVTFALARPARLGATRLVAVDGPSGSGKTSLAAPLATAFAAELSGTVLVPCRVAGSVAEPDPAAGAPDPSPAVVPCPARPGKGQGAVGALVTVVSTDLLATWEHPLDWWPVLQRCLLAPIAAGEGANLPVMQWVSGNPRPGGAVTVPPVDVLILEGVSAGRRAVADRLSALIWVEVPDPAARLERAVSRDGEAMRQYLKRWQRDEDAHFAADRTRGRADIVVNPG